MGISIDVSELNTLVADLGQVPSKVAVAARAATVNATFDIERDAKTFAPVDTGNLRNSIGHSDLRMSLDDIAVEIGPTAHYGRYVEEGTSRMAPHAYLGPAFDRHAGSWVAALEQLVGDIL